MEKGIPIYLRLPHGKPLHIIEKEMFRYLLMEYKRIIIFH